MVREIYENELKDLLELYLHLHESTISEMSEYLSKTWNCVFSTAGHAIDSEQRGQGLEIALPITVGDNVWIGTNVFVLPGVTIGNNTIIGAGSVVNKNIPDGVIAAGNPCKVIRKITDSDKKNIQFLRKIMNILIIEDDAAIRQELKLLLENALYQVTVLTEFHHVVEDILQIEPDLLLLDVNLPQQSGFEICKSIRKTSDVPIIFLTSRTDSMDELSGMLQGGDAYITKPFQPPLLLAHIAAVLKRAKKADVPEKMICKGVELDVVRGCVKCQEQQVDLSKNELKILHYLFLHQGEIVPRIELVEYLWDQQVFIDDNALSVNITRLRAKLAEIGVCDFIETKRGMGYRI